MMINTAVVVPHNPYIIGRPIYEPEHFYGREDLFLFIKDNLIQGTKIILLYGQRRIGKSSVLLQIPLKLVDLDNFLFIPLSLEGKSYKELNGLLYDLATDIKDYLIDELELDPLNFTLPSPEEFQSNRHLFVEHLLSQISAYLPHKNFVFLIDEFDILVGEINNDSVDPFVIYLKQLIEKTANLFVIPVIGRPLEDMPSSVRSLFRSAPNKEIGLLEPRQAQKLITQPAQAHLNYKNEAIETILNLTAGHPYFTQIICFNLFSNAQEEERWFVTSQDVKNLIDKSIESAEGGLAWFRDGLPIPERVVFSAVAEAQEKGDIEPQNVMVEPLKYLEGYGVEITDILRQAPKRLVKWGFLENGVEDTDLPAQKIAKYRVKLELVRRWLVKRHPLFQEIRELEIINPQANEFYQLGTQFSQEGKLLNALKFYEPALTLNPNHFQALFSLAEGYLNAAKNYDDYSYFKALQLYQRAYKVDPTRNREGLIQALLTYGKQLRDRQECNEAKQQFEQVLHLQPDHTIAIQSIKEIQQHRKQLKRNIIFGVSLGTITGIAATIFFLLTQVVSYRNNSYAGTEIKSPETWQKQEIDDAVVGKGVNFISPLVNSSDTFAEQVSLQIIDFSKQPISLEEYSNKSLAKIRTNSPNSLLEQQITLDTRPAIQVIYTGIDKDTKIPLKIRQIWTLKDNKVYLITYKAELDKYDKYNKIVDEMINSFTILNLKN